MTRRRLVATLVAMGGAAAMLRARAAGAGHDHQHMDHSAHMAAAQQTAVKETEQAYQVPAVTLVDQTGRKVAIDKALDDGRPVLLNFIFTSCTTVCPVMTQIFTQVQAQLGDDVRKVHMVSISIDPEYDTPSRLLAYGKEHGTGAQWDFYTGTLEASIAVQKAFDAYRGDKMNHTPLTLLRAARSKSWLRLDGFAGPDTIVARYRSLSG
jgi:protein SCO1/2